MAKIITLTMNPALDKSTSVSTVAPEIKMRCRQPAWQAGGGGINVARVVQRLGGDVLAVYPKGGTQGEFFQQLLDEENIPSQTFSVDGQTRENFAVYEETSGVQYRFNMPGPYFDEQAWGRGLELLQSYHRTAEYLVLSGSLPPGVPDDYYARIAANLDGQVRVIVDTSGAPLKRAAEAGLYLIKPNLRELRELVGRELEHEREQCDAARELIQTGKAQNVIVSLGAAGALLVTEDAVEFIRAPTVKIRSKVGAGDSMVGGIVAKLAAGADVADAARYGVAAGAAAVTTDGSELCHAADVEQLYQHMR